MNFGLIGYGAWGSYHAEAIAQGEGTEMMAIAFKRERTYQKARGDYPETAVYRDYKELLKQVDVEVQISEDNDPDHAGSRKLATASAIALTRSTSTGASTRPSSLSTVPTMKPSASR